MKIQYHALFVDDVEKLKAMFPPVHKNLFYHHCTIEFAPLPTKKIKVGTKVKLPIVGRLTTDKVDALVVLYPESKNKIAHITLSTAEGVKPFESNDEFRRHPTRMERIIPPKLIPTTEGYFDGTKVTSLK